MKAGLTPADLRDWISARLDPLDESWACGDWGERETRSDFDLGQGPPPPDGAPLKDAAVLVALVERPAGLSVILTRRADTLRSHTGQVAFPGGRCDPGETPWATALREAHEEIGLEPSQVTLAGLSSPYRTGTGYHVVPVVGFVTPPFTLSPNPDEVADIFETPFLFLMDPANYEQRQGKSPAGEERRFYAITWEDRLVWGATAGMLRALHDRLEGEPPKGVSGG
ncbi:MAG: MutT/nudix family protein [Caulobacteraceae bacterium]|jgi:8-oxo-dGTP pyrophosphatase MutT (NUDIX family)|nr:MutT/nudix family protein [Caulobacteraceae bacterium]